MPKLPVSRPFSHKLTPQACRLRRPCLFSVCHAVLRLTALFTAHRYTAFSSRLAGKKNLIMRRND